MPLDRLRANIRRYSAPNTAVYEHAAAVVLAPFFRRVARELAPLAPARVLDVGSGPGQLALAIAAGIPAAAVTGLDLDPEMVERARRRASSSPAGARVTFTVGDAAALPFPDASFDAVVSTFSMHHWDDAPRALGEVHRVLRPGGIARIYDVADWIARLERRGPEVPAALARSPFAKGTWRRMRVAGLGPVPFAVLTELEHAAR